MAVTINGTTGIVTPDLGVDGTTLVVDAANDRVGIGQSSPTKKLEVGGGAVSFSPDVAGKHTHEFTTNAANDARYFLRSDTTTKVDIQANGASYFNGGNVGIGTNNPAGTLHAHAPNSGLSNIRLSGTASGQVEYDIRQGIVGVNNAGFSIRDITNSATRFAITSDGNIGIGTDTFTATSSGRQIVEIEGASGSLINFAVGGARKAYHFTDGTDVYSYNTANGAYIIGSNDTARLRIDNVGWLGLNQTTKDNAGQVAAFKNVSNTHSWLNVNVNNNTGVSGVVFGDSDSWSPGYIQYRHSTDDMEIITNGGERLRITSAGRFGFNTTSPTVSIDLSNNTDALSLPTGTTAQRPSGTDAYIRKNITNNALEFYNGTNWVEIITDYFPTGSTTLG